MSQQLQQGRSLVDIHRNCDNFCVKVKHESCKHIKECHRHFKIDQCADHGVSAERLAMMHKEYLETKYKNVWYNQWKYYTKNCNTVIQMCLDAPWSEDVNQQVIFEVADQDMLRKVLALTWRVKIENGMKIAYSDGNATTNGIRMVDYLYPGKHQFAYDGNNAMDLRRSNLRYECAVDYNKAEEGEGVGLITPFKFRKVHAKSTTAIPHVWEQTGAYPAFRIEYYDGVSNRTKFFSYKGDDREQKKIQAAAFRASHALPRPGKKRKAMTTESKME